MKTKIMFMKKIHSIRRIELSFLRLLIVILFGSVGNLIAQDAILPFPQISFSPSTTQNGGMDNEVTFSQNGCFFSSSSYTGCLFYTSGYTLRIDGDADYFDITTPNGEIEKIDITIGANSSTAANAVIAFSADGVTWSNFQELAMPANNSFPSCNTHSLNPSTGMKYFRMMRKEFGGYVPIGTVGQTVRIFKVSVWVGPVVPEVHGVKLSVNNSAWPNKTIIETGWNADIGDYTEINVPGSTPNNSFIRLIQNGNVGIGTTNPQNALDVKGTIRATEVKVESVDNFPDFVFDKDYQLPCLEEVDQFVQTNGHLPNIPSAKEVKQNGMNLAEMQVKLLQKVEELTLYSIQQQQYSIQQQKEIQALKVELESLKNK